MNTNKANLFIAKVMYLSILLSFVILLIGGILYLYQHAHELMQMQIVPAQRQDIPTMLGNIFQGVQQGNSSAILQLGLMLVLFSQILRIFLLTLLFILERDGYFTAFSFIILGILLHGVLF